MQEKVQRHFVDEVACFRFLSLCKKLSQFSDLKQHIFIISQFPWIGHGLAQSSAQGINQSCDIM